MYGYPLDRSNLHLLFSIPFSSKNFADNSDGKTLAFLDTRQQSAACPAARTPDADPAAAVATSRISRARSVCTMATRIVDTTRL